MNGETTPKQLMGMGRRKHIRLSVMGGAQLTTKGGEARLVYLACIGRGGVGLYMHEESRPNQLVVIDLKLMEERLIEMELKFAARVRWVQPVGKLFMVGLKFEKMPNEKYTFLLRHLRLMKQLQL